MIVSILLVYTVMLLTPTLGRVRAADIVDAIMLLAIAVLARDSDNDDDDNKT